MIARAVLHFALLAAMLYLAAEIFRHLPF